VTLGQVEDQLQQERQDSVRYAEAIAAADSLSARRDTLLQKVRIIREIDTDRYVWAHILDNVSNALPEFTWLVGMEQTAGLGSEVEFRIDGMTGLTAALTRFMRDLEASPFIRDVRLVSQEQSQQGQRLVNNFVLMARYQMPDSTAISTEPIILVGE
jgi:Tfp pilus assembly protein PilN